MPPPKRGRAPRRALNPQEEASFTVVPAPSGGRVSKWLIALILVLSTVVIVSSLHVLSKMSAEGGAVGDARGLRGGGGEVAPSLLPSTLPAAPAPVAESAPAPKKKKYFCSECLHAYISWCVFVFSLRHSHPCPHHPRSNSPFFSP